MLITSTCDAFTISAARVLIAGEVVEYGLQNAFLCSVLLLLVCRGHRISSWTHRHPDAE
ncbi:hypothetical protein ACVW06_000176 [Pantoea ananatis]|nr:hypothetical protein C7421_107207 [Pantoea ananatis]